MGLFDRFFKGKAAVAYYTWHVGPREDLCATCKAHDGACWVPEKGDAPRPPLKTGCLCPGGCTCRALQVMLDEAWGPGNAEWIRKRGGYVTGAQMAKFTAS